MGSSCKLVINIDPSVLNDLLTDFYKLYIFKGLYKTNKSMHDIFWSAGNATFRYRMSFSSNRTGWARAEMDPRWPGSYYRSIVGELSMSAASWR